MRQLELNSTRLLIRNLKESDLSNFYAYRSNPEVTKYQGFDVMDMAAAQSFIAKQTDKKFGEPGVWVQYAIENKESGNLIGDCAIKLDAYDPRIAEIGMTVAPQQQQKGYAKEAMTVILNFLFNVNFLHRVVETVDAENIASINLLKSLQFRQEGHFIENIFFKGKWGTEFQYAMLKREWDLLQGL